MNTPQDPSSTTGSPTNKSSGESGKTWLEVLAKAKADEEERQQRLKEEQQREAKLQQQQQHGLFSCPDINDAPPPPPALLHHHHNEDLLAVVAAAVSASSAGVNNTNKTIGSTVEDNATINSPSKFSNLSNCDDASTSQVSLPSSFDPERASVSAETAFTFDTASSWATDDDCFLDAVYKDQSSNKPKKQKPWRVVDTRRNNAERSVTFLGVSAGSGGGAGGGAGGAGGGGLSASSSSSAAVASSSSQSSAGGSRFESLFKKGK